MIFLVIILFIVFLAGLASAVFLLGFRLGGDSTEERLVAVRMESLRAQRALHDITRAAFVRMTEEAAGAAAASWAMSGTKTLAQRALDVALTLAAAIWLLTWSWRAVQPLVPALVFAALLYGFFEWRRR